MYDVLIVGGGPAGASAAIHLAGQGAHVLLLEGRKFPRAKLCGEFISPECFAHFRRLGVWDGMMEAGGARISRTEFYARSGRRVSVPSEWFAGQETWALGLSRAEMDERLLRRARAAGIEVLEEARAVGAVCDEEGRVCGVRAQVSNEERRFHALITIDATGRARALARRVEGHGRKSGARKTKMPLVAFKAHLEGAGVAAGACEIYFYKGGYGGLSSVENNLCNLCFIAASRDVRACANDAGRVMREIVASNRRAAETLRNARVKSEWLAVALESFGRNESVPADGLLTIGDAAAFIDPFTGSGMLMALESGALAAETIARHLPALRAGAAFAALANAYRDAYRQRFAERLRVCTHLRRAAFAPQLLTEAATLALAASQTARRALARATRRTH